MGRGRAKAKQTKVARSLKYRTSDTDFDSLGRELRGGDAEGGEPEPQIPDQYADLVDRYADEDDDDREDLRRSG